MATTDESSNLKIGGKVFTGDAAESFESWTVHMESIFILRDWIVVLEATIANFRNAGDDGKVINMKIFAALCASTGGFAQQQVRSFSADRDGRAAWRSLKERFASNTSARVCDLNMQLLNRTWKPEETVASFRNSILTLYAKLEATKSDQIIQKGVLVSFVLKQLPSRFSPIVALYMAKPDTRIDEVFESLRLFDEMQPAVEPPVSAPVAFATTSKPHQPQRFSGRCHNCGIFGHKIADCRNKKPQQRQQRQATSDSRQPSFGSRRTTDVAWVLTDGGDVAPDSFVWIALVLHISVATTACLLIWMNAKAIAL